MNKISLTSNNFAASITIPIQFVDEYMPTANGSYVKVYLYLIRCLQDAACDLSIASIADRFDNTENDIIRALTYWEKVGLLSLEHDGNGELSSIMLRPMPAPSVVDERIAPAPISSKAVASPAINPNSIADPRISLDELASGSEHEADFIKPHYTQNQITEITSDDEVKYMLHVIELYMERPLKAVDVQLILYLYESLSFSQELIMYLYEYCISKNKKNASYIEAVALSWAKEGIDSVEKAEASTTIYNANYNAVNKAFGLNRMPGNVEQQYINKWMSKYKFGIDIIVEACNRTILQTQKPDFKYADKILENWSKKQVSCIADITQLDDAHKKATSDKLASSTGKKTTTAKSSTNKFNAFPQREYSEEEFAAIEQKLLNSGYVGKKRV